MDCLRRTLPVTLRISTIKTYEQSVKVVTIFPTFLVTVRHVLPPPGTIKRTLNENCGVMQKLQDPEVPVG